MSRITITRAHQQSPEQLHHSMQELAEKLVGRYGGEYRWQQDRLHYSHSGGVEARVGFDAQSLSVDIRTGILMSAFSGMIRAEVEDYLDKNLDKNLGEA